MGNARWDRATYASYNSTRSSTLGVDDLTKASISQVFENRDLPQNLDPKKIDVRESCDSEANPNSTPIILGLDITGSMGQLAHRIAATQLPQIMEGIYEQSPVTDPHVMFMGIGDAFCDRAPLQVSQFEAGANPLAEQLQSLFIEGAGGGNSFESYDMPWYFAAHKTKIDSFDRRGQKGYLFTFGDELPPQQHFGSRELNRVFGTDNLPNQATTADLLKEAQKRWKVFHAVIEEGSYARSNLRRTREAWTELLGPNALFVRDTSYLPQIIIATLQISDGADINAVIVNRQSDREKEELEYAFHNALKSQ